MNTQIQILLELLEDTRISLEEASIERSVGDISSAIDLINDLSEELTNIIEDESESF